MNKNNVKKDKNNKENHGEILTQHCNQLMEHFDSVIILVTTHNAKDNTSSANWRQRGNYYTNSGALQAYLARDDEGTREQVRNNEENDNEEWKSK